MPKNSILKDELYNEIIYTDEVRPTVTVENTKQKQDLVIEGIPILPASFKHIYQELYVEKYSHELSSYCNCGNCLGPYNQCHHMENTEFKQFFEELPMRLAHLQAVNSASVKEIKQIMFNKAIIMLNNSPCQPDEEMTRNFNPITNTYIIYPKQECHVYKDLQQMFPQDYAQHFEPKKLANDNSKRNGKIMINLSFMSSFILLAAILIALAISKSMSILATAIDLLLEILSGIVLFISVKLARKGIQQGQFQRTIHHNNPNNIKYIYAQRYESLGVLSFSCIMGTCSIILAATCISKIVSIVQGEDSQIEFGIVPMSIILFTLTLKVFLVTGCHIAAKQNPLQKDALLAYRDDHRNDIMSNSLGFIGAMLSSNLKGKWELCDPIASFILSIYILCNWAGNAITQMKQLTGHQVDQEIIDDMMIRLLHQFNPKITEVEGFVGYQSGQQIVLEITLKVANTTTIQDAHNLCQKIQNGFECEVPGIERCFVHVETEDCKNEF
ncbi:Cation_efflux family protein [Hexamita inflata]|uniref:Cation efflux family protein n=1 Tax=Hexamita inflata TaxID=28002 RepID=A0AA86Q731_9EUKA|nr:Cation efflux family protein [Hexamita inflata]